MAPAFGYRGPAVPDVFTVIVEMGTGASPAAELVDKCMRMRMRRSYSVVFSGGYFGATVFGFR